MEVSANRRKGKGLRDTSAKDCLHLFNTDIQGRLDPGWQAGVLHQRTRTIKAGPMAYVECFPVWDTRSAKAAKNEAQKETHKRAQDRVHARNARRKLERLVNANFGEGDLIVTCTYAQDEGPEDEKRAQRDVAAYLRRIANMRKRRGLPQMRYIYITEKTSSLKHGVRYHHHVRRDHAEGCAGCMEEEAQGNMQCEDCAAHGAPFNGLCTVYEAE